MVLLRVWVDDWFGSLGKCKPSSKVWSNTKFKASTDEIHNDKKKSPCTQQLLL